MQPGFHGEEHVSDNQNEPTVSAPQQTDTDKPSEEKPEERPNRTLIQGEVGIESAQVWLSAFLIVVAGLVCYSQVFDVPWHAMDREAIADNTAMHSLAAFPFADGNSGGLLTKLTLALNWAITPDSSRMFHAFNLLLHLANAVLLFFLCRALLDRSIPPVIPMLGGMLLVLHPLTTESLNAIVGRSGLMATLFVLISLLLYARAAKNDETSWAGVLASALFYALAMACSSIAVTLPLLIIGLDMALHGPIPDRKRWPLYAPFLAIMLIELVAGVSLRPTLGGPFVEYVRASFAPFGLAVLHTTSASSAAASYTLFGVLILVALFLLALLPAAGFGLLWLTLSAFTASLGTSVLVERQAYFPLAGLCVLLPAIVSRIKWQPLRVVGGLVAAVIVLVAGTGTYLRNSTWQDEVLLWSDAAAKAPQSPIPPLQLGRVFLAGAQTAPVPTLAKEALSNAEGQFRKASELDPANLEAMEGLASVLMQSGKGDDALAQLREVLRRDPGRRSAIIHTANLLLERFTAAGNREDYLHSVEYFRAADKLTPLDGDHLARFASALTAQGDFEDAEPLLARVAQADSSSPAKQTLQQIQDNLKRVKAMEQQASALLSKDPKDPNGLKLKAQLLALKGQAVDASYVLEQLRKAGFQDFPVWILTGFVSAKMDAVDRFISECASPPPLPTGVKSAWFELARMCAGSGLWDAARAYLESPVALMESSLPPNLTLADIAMQLQQSKRAYDYLKHAADSNPTDPVPWLKLCDLAIGGKDLNSARQYLVEAETRNAPVEELAKRKKALGMDPNQAASPTRTVIR